MASAEALNNGLVVDASLNALGGCEAHPVRASNMEELKGKQKKKVFDAERRGSASVAKALEHRIEGNVRHHENAITDHSGKFLAANKHTTDAGLKATKVYHNASVAELYEQALKHEEGTHIVANGALATMSGAKMGRSPKDKRVVREPESEANVWWGQGSPNHEIDEISFLINRERAIDFLNSRERLYVFDGFVNWEAESRFKVRVITSRAYHALFMYNMLIRPSKQELEEFGDPDFVIYNAGEFPANSRTTHVGSKTCVSLSLKHAELVILGTQYAGEMKKGVFTAMHYYMPLQNKLSLHSGCNVGAAGDVSLFFGLSGTGKTTLSADPARPLIGDDEHVWSDNGIFNIEGGCYAKAINLTKEKEPDIYEAIKFGTVLENIVFEEDTREVDYDASTLTENTRASYPIEYIENARIPCVGPHPKNVILLTCDAFGVLPPVAKLTNEQAMYHFISGYTAKVAGTEMGVTEPEATFSACFGSAFLMWHPMKYADMLAERLQKHGATAWLVNTGWSGGAYGEGARMSLKVTRAIIDAIHSGELVNAPTTPGAVFNLPIPTKCSNVDPAVLNPKNTWKDKAKFDATLAKLGGMFIKNFKRYEATAEKYVSKELAATIVAAGPDPAQSTLIA